MEMEIANANNYQKRYSRIHAANGEEENRKSLTQNTQYTRTKLNKYEKERKDKENRE